MTTDAATYLGPGDVRMILTFTPAGIANFFQETLQPTQDPTADIPDNRDAVAARYATAAPRYGIAVPHRVASSRATVMPLMPLTRADDGEDAGVVVLAADGSTAFADEVAAAWMDELGGNGSAPPAVRAVAMQARSVVADGARRPDRRARVRAKSGRWLVVRASVSQRSGRAARGDDRARAPARARAATRRRLPLTEREREVPASSRAGCRPR